MKKQIKFKITEGKKVYGYTLFDQELNAETYVIFSEAITMAQNNEIEKVKVNSKKNGLIGDGIDLRRIPSVKLEEIKDRLSINNALVDNSKKQEITLSSAEDIVYQKEASEFTELTGLPATPEQMDIIQKTHTLWACNVTDTIEKAYKYLLCECKYCVADYLYKNNYPISIHPIDIDSIKTNPNWSNHILEFYGIHHKFNTIAEDFEKQINQLGYEKLQGPYSISPNSKKIQYYFLDKINFNKELILCLNTILTKQGLQTDITVKLVQTTSASDLNKHRKKIEKVKKDIIRKYNLVSLDENILK